jgi:replicative superfamily II helicase
VHESGEEPGEELKRVLNARMLPTSQEARSAKMALLLLAWSKGEDMSQLESRYQCYAGTIMTASDEASWLVDAAAEIAEVMGWNPAEHLAELAACMRFGVSPACLPLARAQLPGLSRDDIRTLVEAGLRRLKRSVKCHLTFWNYLSLAQLIRSAPPLLEEKRNSFFEKMAAQYDGTFPNESITQLRVPDKAVFP